MSFDLRAARLNRGRTQRELAAEIGVSRRVLEAAERGDSVPHPANAHKIAQFFGLQVTDLWPRTEDEDDSEADVPGEMVA